MPEIEATGPNAEQIKYWNERGPTWVQLQDRLDQQLRPLGDRVIERAAVAAGERVLDIGCGCGDSTLRLAQRVGTAGAVVGVDISAGMLQRAAERARSAGLAQVAWVNADAQTHRFTAPPFDVVFSRFGVMFFADPTAAFTNLRTALRPGGRLAFVCWQALPENPWMFVPLMAALQHVQLPAMPPPDAPGPFAFADRDRVRTILATAGFGAIDFEAVQERMTVGGGAGLEEAVDFMLLMGPTGQLLREAGGELVAQVRSSVRDALSPYMTENGLVMPGAAWIVTASAS